MEVSWNRPIHTSPISGWWFGIWFFIFPYIGNNHPIWLSYFSEGEVYHQPEGFSTQSSIFIGFSIINHPFIDGFFMINQPFWNTPFFLGWIHHIFHRDLPWNKPTSYPLVNVYIAMERSTIFHGKTHDFNGHGFNSKLLVYQRIDVGLNHYYPIIPCVFPLYSIIIPL